MSVPLPFVGSVTLTRPEMAYVGGIAALGLLGLLDWPLALVVAGGHLLAADRHSRAAQEFGEALEQA